MKKNKAKPHILLVEDEETLAIGLEFNLQAEGFEVDLAADGRQALELYVPGKYDLIVLDLMLPYVDGFEVARRVRTQDARQPILMLTARTQAADKISGLQAGADDYLTKPFHLQELLLRVQGMLKRKSWYETATEDESQVRFGRNEVNFDNLQWRSAKGAFQLTAQEAMLLRYLIDHKNKVVSREELLENVWNIHSDVETRTVDNFIVRLRKYFEDDPSNPQFIKSVRSKGYLFELKE